jgi:hypothetical protein
MQGTAQALLSPPNPFLEAALVDLCLWCHSQNHEASRSALAGRSPAAPRQPEW